MQKFPSTGANAAIIIAHALIDICGGSERMARNIMEAALAMYPIKPTKTNKRAP
jgi:hypothetical protein